MDYYKKQIQSLFKRLLGLLLPYFFYRALFLFFYYNQFEPSTLWQKAGAFILGCRFDVLVICWSNLGYVLISLWPNRRYFNTKFQGVLKILYLSCNGLALLTNSIDLAYFKHTNKRLGFDTIHQLFTGQMDLSAQWDD